MDLATAQSVDFEVVEKEVIKDGIVVAYAAERVRCCGREDFEGEQDCFDCGPR